MSSRMGVHRVCCKLALSTATSQLQQSHDTIDDSRMMLPSTCDAVHVAVAVCAVPVGFVRPLLLLARGYDAASGEWTWTREAPPSQKASGGGDVVKKLKKKVQ
jgi:hypothetical protein